MPRGFIFFSSSTSINSTFLISDQALAAREGRFVGAVVAVIQQPASDPPQSSPLPKRQSEWLLPQLTDPASYIDRDLTLKACIKTAGVVSHQALIPGRAPNIERSSKITTPLKHSLSHSRLR